MAREKRKLLQERNASLGAWFRNRVGNNPLY